MEDRMSHMNYLQDVQAEDLRVLRVKERTYGGSWKRRGGAGAFMMLARKWDRLETMLGGDSSPDGVGWGYDVFRAVESEERDHRLGGADGTVLAEVRDLRRYLLLVESEMMARGVVKPSPTQAGLSAQEAMAAELTPAPPPAPPPAPLDDSNKHAQRDDAVDVESISTDDIDGLHPDDDRVKNGRAPRRTIVVPGKGGDTYQTRYSIIDRLLVTKLGSMHHLMQLRHGVNSVELNETVPIWFRHMYAWVDDSSQWELLRQYRVWSETGHR